MNLKMGAASIQCNGHCLEKRQISEFSCVFYVTAGHQTFEVMMV